MTDTNETPLIYTTRGNEPIDGLVLVPAWEFFPDANGNLGGARFTEEYFCKRTGESVKKSVHVWQK